ncbi:ropporin-1-like protein [Macrobrachium nipponense]|uniref:ropporin-1-like protein n=1 Tax=Macrobrachium nipponense TaxID=159736 RepID=UPI0030C8A3BF
MVVATLGETRVPSALPRILKDYTKAAIRTQPKDLLIWSAAYFRAMTKGTVPPVKDRLEFPVPESKSGISPGVLRVLHRQLHEEDGVSWEALRESCRAMGVAEETAQDAWQRSEGTEGARVDWDVILTHIADLSTHSIVEALQLVMLAVTDDPITRRVPSSVVIAHYSHLHSGSNITPSAEYEEAVAYLNDIANYQDGFLVPSDLTRPSCPPLK